MEEHSHVVCRIIEPLSHCAVLNELWKRHQKIHVFASNEFCNNQTNKRPNYLLGWRSSQRRSWRFKSFGMLRCIDRCILVHSYRQFVQCCITIFLNHPEDGSSKALRNMYDHIPIYTASREDLNLQFISYFPPSNVSFFLEKEFWSR